MQKTMHRIKVKSMHKHYYVINGISYFTMHTQYTQSSRADVAQSGKKDTRSDGEEYLVLIWGIDYYLFFRNESNNRPEIISIFALFRKRKTDIRNVLGVHGTGMRLSIRCISLAKSTKRAHRHKPCCQSIQTVCVFSIAKSFSLISHKNTMHSPADIFNYESSVSWFFFPPSFSYRTAITDNIQCKIDQYD